MIFLRSPILTHFGSILGLILGPILGHFSTHFGSLFRTDFQDPHFAPNGSKIDSKRDPFGEHFGALFEDRPKSIFERPSNENRYFFTSEASQKVIKMLSENRYLKKSPKITTKSPKWTLLGGHFGTKNRSKNRSKNDLEKGPSKKTCLSMEREARLQ